MSLRRYFEILHQQKHLPLWAHGLLPLSWGYALGVLLRLGAYRCGLLNPLKVSAPVISVGNLTTGGTGKTPVVIALARHFLNAGKRVVILSRGYGASNPQPYVRATSIAFGDEAALIQSQVPQAIVISGRNRAANAQQAIQDYQPDVIILDDGYQYLKLHRDVNCLLVDGQLGFGNQHLLPAGPLREPLCQQKRADVILLTKTILPSIQQQFSHAAKPVYTVPFHAISTPISESATIFACCGIARPQSFLDTLAALNIHTKQFQAFSDHHPYTVSDIPGTVLNNPDAVILTTEKDAIKLKAILPEAQHAKLRSIGIEPHLPVEFLAQLDRLL